MHVACRAAKSLRPDQRCVVILADGVRNYLTKFISDEWMVEKGFMEASDELEEMIDGLEWYPFGSNEIKIDIKHLIKTQQLCRVSNFLETRSDISDLVLFKSSSRAQARVFFVS